VSSGFSTRKAGGGATFLVALTESIKETAVTNSEKHLGPKEEVGNKPVLREVERGASLSNRLRAVMA